jgi:hypothetical protein
MENKEVVKDRKCPLCGADLVRDTGMAKGYIICSNEKCRFFEYIGRE